MDPENRRPDPDKHGSETSAEHQLVSPWQGTEFGQASGDPNQSQKSHNHQHQTRHTAQVGRNKETAKEHRVAELQRRSNARRSRAAARGRRRVSGHWVSGNPFYEMLLSYYT